MLPHFLAQISSDVVSSSREWEWPFTWWDWIPILLLLLAGASTLWFARRDARQTSLRWSLGLAALRLAVIAVALIIALNPHERTQTDAYRDSRVILLVDTSQSMQQPQTDPRQTPGGIGTSRADAVREVLEKSDLLNRLRADHVVDVYTFDSSLSELAVRLPSTYSPQDSAAAEPAVTAADDPATTIDWKKLLTPSGVVTRLGDSLDNLLVETKSPTLSGVVIFSDGASNAGRDITHPRERAGAQGVKLVTVGVGSTEQPVNLEVVRIIAPTDVQKGDEFDLSAIIRGQSLIGKTFRVDLLQQGPNDPEPTVVYSQDETLGEDGAPREITFHLKPSDPGQYEYTVRARLPEGLETRDDDNQLSRAVNLFDRPLRVLVMAGGPMRDYHFAHTSLYRHPSMQVDVWLQSGNVGISQEANKLLFRFPESPEELYDYDVLLAFDADWSLLTPEQLELIVNWVSNEGGGLLTIAGDVFTPTLVSKPELEPIRKLYPVRLEAVGLGLAAQEASQTPFPLIFTQEGDSAEFLKLEETGDQTAWEQFAGIFRTYPTMGAKAGTTIYAEFSDPLSRGAGGQPIVLAGQRYGQGQVLYLGSPEMWRLRAINQSYLDRFWIKMVRKAAEGRSKRGQQRSMFILDGREFMLGQSIALRLRALTPQFQPLVTDTVRIDVYGPGGVPMVPGPQLLRDPIRPAEFVGEFRPLVPGRYRLEFPVPESAERVVNEIDVQLPRQEAASLVQDAALLERLTTGTGGAYVPIAQAASVIPQLLPNRGERVMIDQQIRELWDRRWLMYLLGALLSVEWLIRKLLKLA
ncbi:hypothetical protein [Planctomicrobium sp. SH664]|uniref:hypothetical protein n=1 Tax=Planctomicrobium sp. SH664 TaxID=3448125 RepID=UPI003F5B30D2